MMNFIKLCIRQPVTVAVGIILIVMAGVLSLRTVPIQLTPNVESTVISVRTFWEGASPAEVEQEIVDRQEDKLQGLANLVEMTSQSRQSEGTIRLEFHTGTDKDVALREVSDKLREVPEYPETADEPVIEATDPTSRDYIAWIVLTCTDPALDIRTLHDFVEDRVKPTMERVAGVSEVNVLGGRERELQIRFDPMLLALRAVTPTELVGAIRGANRNISAGELADGKSDVRVRTIGQYEHVEAIEQTVVAHTEAGGPILVGDIADVVETFKEPRGFVRSRGRPVLAINVQREVGSNVIEVMAGVEREIERLNSPTGLLATETRRLGLAAPLRLEQVYDQTIYIDQALDLVQSNIWVGGGLAIGALLVFLRSFRAVAVIGLAVPISVIGAIVVLVGMGRSVNVISLAGLAFAVGMTVDNSIVVLENIFRHLEMGKKPAAAAYDASREVWGALVAATLTNIVVLIPVIFIQDAAGLLFRDIALAIAASVLLSLVVSVTVIPTVSVRWLKPHKHASHEPHKRSRLSRITKVLFWPLDASPDFIAGLVRVCMRTVWLRVTIVLSLTVGSILGSIALMPPADYLPAGNRNLVIGMMIPPPGYNLEQSLALAQRAEATMRPAWEAAELPAGSPEREAAERALPMVPTFDFGAGRPGAPVQAPSITNYFTVASATGGFNGLFHGAVGADDRKVAVLAPLMQHATRAEALPGVLAFAFQLPLFRIAGTTGSAVKIDFSGRDLEEVSRAALAVYMDLAQRYGFGAVQPDPANFNLPGPELQVIPQRVRLNEVGMSPVDLGLAVQAAGDGAIIGEYRVGGETIDLKLISAQAVGQETLAGLGDLPIATPIGQVVPLSSLADLRRVTSAPQINRTDRLRSVTLQLTAPDGVPLEQAIADVEGVIAAHREDGTVPATVETFFTGSASKLKSVMGAIMGDGTFIGTMGSSLVVALVVTYLLMCVLFQSFSSPLVIMFSVPPAMLGGFLALAIVHAWSVRDWYMPAQNLDVLTMLGFIILIGVVVNNAILIVHQAMNFMRGVDADGNPTEALRPHDAIVESVRSRVRPILMSVLTSVIGMLPLVLAPGSGSELYRGLGAVLTGGLIVSTIFTMLLVPLLYSLTLDAALALAGRRDIVPQPIAPAV